MSDLVYATFERVAASLRDMSTTANVKEVREKLPELATEVRETQDPSSALPELAGRLDEMAESFKPYPWNAKAQVGPKLAELLAWIEETTPPRALDAKNRLEEIEGEIHSLGAQAARSLIQIGGLLREARDEYAKSDTFSFLSWCEGNFGFKKAYVYRLIAVNEKFGDDPVLSGVAMGALAHLTSASPEKLEQARKLAAEGGLDVKTAKSLAKGEGASEAPQMHERVKGPELPRQNVAPAPAPNPEHEPGSVQQVTPQQYESEQVAQLQAIIADLREQIRSMMEDRATGARKSGSSAQMPSLPQFKSKSMPARLGLDPEEAKDPKEVRAAFRGLVKAGYGESHPDHPAINEALEQLTSS